jgi:hypothetical protein
MPEIIPLSVSEKSECLGYNLETMFQLVATRQVQQLLRSLVRRGVKHVYDTK